MEKECRVLIEKHGDFPEKEVLRELGLGSLHQAINTYHGGMRAVRERLGLPELQKPNNFWKDWENVKRTLVEIIKEEGRFPTSDRFKQMGQSSLVASFALYYGGTKAVRLRLQEEGVLPSEQDNLQQLVEQYIEQ